MRPIVICDIDGTICKLGDRLKYLQQDPPNWDEFYDHCFEDEPIEEIIMLIQCLTRYSEYTVIFFTGRRKSCEGSTQSWIAKHIGPGWQYSKIFYRENNDHRHDTEVKPEFLNFIDKERIAFIIEDRDSMVKKWRELGFICLQPFEGNF